MKIFSHGIFLFSVSLALFPQDPVLNTYSQRLMRFYQNPDATLLDETIKHFSQKNSLNAHARLIVVVFHARLFQDGVWKALFQEKTAVANNTYLQAFLSEVNSVDLESAKRNDPPTPSGNDLLWGCFFASGDPAYLSRLTDIAERHSGERVDVNTFLTGMSAAWSLSSNANRLPEVRDYLEARGRRGTPFVLSLLQRSPGEWRQEMMEVLKKQRKAGIW